MSSVPPDPPGAKPPNRGPRREDFATFDEYAKTFQDWISRQPPEARPRITQAPPPPPPSGRPSMPPPKRKFKRPADMDAYLSRFPKDGQDRIMSSIFEAIEAGDPITGTCCVFGTIWREACRSADRSMVEIDALVSDSLHWLARTQDLLDYPGELDSRLEAAIEAEMKKYRRSLRDVARVPEGPLMPQGPPPAAPDVCKTPSGPPRLALPAPERPMIVTPEPADTSYVRAVPAEYAVPELPRAPTSPITPEAAAPELGATPADGSAIVPEQMPPAPDALQENANGAGNKSAASMPASVDDRPTYGPLTAAEEMAVRKKLRGDYIAELKEKRVRVTDTKIAKAACPTWTTRDPIRKWLALDPRYNGAPDLKIRKVFKEKPHLPKT